MKITANIVLISSRIFAIIFALFLSVFALDVFDSNTVFLEKFFGYLISIIPSIIIISICILSLKKIFIASLLYFFSFIIFTIIFRTYHNYISFVIISLPILIISVTMFWANNRLNLEK